MTVTASDILHAYDGFETSFAGTEELERYRASKLTESQRQATLIRKHCAGAQSFYEVGTGNGRLLIALAQGPCVFAEGIDVSASRIAFAQRWAEDLKLKAVRFTVADGLVHAPAQQVDCACCITGAFGYFDILAPDGGRRLLQQLAASVKPGGWLVLEVYTHARDMKLMHAQNMTELRTWRELPASDPWQYYLSYIVFDPATKVLQHYKTFIRRADGFIDRKKEALRLYTEAELRAELARAGFKVTGFFSDWDGNPANPDSELQIVVAQQA